MKHTRLLRLICAAVLIIGASALAHRAAAGVRHCSPQIYAVEVVKEVPRTLLHGQKLISFAGYELNASFTPGGEFFCFELVAADAKPAGEKLKV